MERMTVSRAAQLCGGTLLPEAESSALLGNVVIDSRMVMPGDLFVAYRGERVDGHDYIASAFARGAAGCLVERVPDGADGLGPLILVPDVQKALEQIAKAYREQFKLPIIGITGSVGKTTAKEMISAVLSRRLRTLKTAGNLNNQIGVPMMISRLDSGYEAAVIEMGISDFGEMRVLADLVRPAVAVFTTIGHAHLEYLHDLDGVLKAKTEMLEYLSDEAPVILNGDDEKLRGLKCRQRKICYGFGVGNDFRALSCETDDSGIQCDVAGGGRTIRLRIPAFGRHHVYAALAAVAVGVFFGLSDEEIIAGIADFHNVERRAELVRTAFITMIDDSYNANPDSVRSGIDTLVQLPGKRHVCILGDMLELGKESGEMHRGVGRYAAEKGVELVLTAGTYGRDTAAGAGEAGVCFESRDALISALPRLIAEGDCLLVKASKGSHFELVSAALRKLAEQHAGAECAGERGKL